MPTATDSATEAHKQRERERAAKYYREHRAAVCARVRNRYANDPQHREAVKRHARETYAARKLAPVAAYRLGYAAGVKDATERNAQTFANFSVPIPPERMARLLDPTLEA